MVETTVWCSPPIPVEHRSDNIYLLTLLINPEMFCRRCTEVRAVGPTRQQWRDVWVVSGLWFSPECEFTRKCLTESQRLVTGSVRLRLSKGNVEILGRSSPSSPYNQDLVSMDVQGDYTPEDAEGFIRITAVRYNSF
ncbi:ASS1 [Cordylochernes scorpioides]|uniref:argininosuccinate synthase n=1 Tax=Cordylochernes scorpioides TaxID=51811 RepID=A0ABY6KLE3_9ARAC|nr:ASS1 [Cordylochernes scorpioides]